MDAPRQTADRFLASARAWWRQGWLPGLLLVIATILAYQPAWHAGFIWDDDRYVSQNRLLIEPDGLKKIWFSTESPSQYCPMVYTSFRIERELWGLSAEGCHWVNILLHAANAVLVALVLRKLAAPGAWLAAAAFALHPVNVESVAWISERKNVLCLLFYLLALLAWINFLRDQPTRSWRAYALALVFFVLALLSKTTACTFPAAMLLVLWLKKMPISRARLGQIVPFVLLGFGMGLLTMWWERYNQGTSGKLFSLGWLERILIASRAIFFYLGKLVWPVNLTFSYPRWPINPADPMAYIWLVALAGLAAAIFKARRFAGRSIETAAVFYVATLSPLLGFIMLYTFRYSYVADHYQYIASIGPLALAGAGLSWGFGHLQKARAFAPALSALLLLTLGILTWRQCQMYASAETLWRATIARNPNSYLAHNNLGTLLLRQGRSDEAMAQFQKVVALAPDYEVGHYDLGHALFRQGRIDDAIAEFRRAVELDPAYAKAHNNLANLLLRQGQPREALVHYESALRLRPKSPDFANNVAWLLATSPDAGIRDGPMAIALALQAESVSQAQEPVFIATLAAAYAEAGQFSEAVATAQRAFELASAQRNPTLAGVLNDQMALYQAGKPFRATTSINLSGGQDSR